MLKKILLSLLVIFAPFLLAWDAFLATGFEIPIYEIFRSNWFWVIVVIYWTIFAIAILSIIWP